MPRYKVWRPSYGETYDDATIYDKTSPQSAAIAYAEFFHNRRDGWEAQWPITVSVRDVDAGPAPVDDILEVERHTVPEFEARRIIQKRSE